MVLNGVQVDVNGEDKYFETACVRGSSTQYVMLPKEISNIVRKARDAEKKATQQNQQKQRDSNQNREYHNDGRNRGNYNRGGRGGYRGGRGGYNNRYQNQQNH